MRPIFTSNYETLEKADSVIVTASVPIDPIEVMATSKSRITHIEYNTSIMCEVTSKLAKNISKDTLIVIMTNPVESMVYALKNAGVFESRNVIGVGTAVEAARYEALISKALGIAREQVVSTVIGGHNENDSIFLPKYTKIGQFPLLYFNLSEKNLLELENPAKTLGWNILRKSNQFSSITPASLAVNLAKAHLNNDAKRVVNCTMEVPLAFVNDMLGDDVIESDEPTVTLGVLALLNSKGAEPQKLPLSQIDTRNLNKAIQNILKQQEMVRTHISHFSL
jgi:malate dehydrogenase